MYTIIKSLYGPSAFELCLFCNFSSLNYKDIILSSSNSLQIYNIIKGEDDYALNNIGKFTFLENIVSLSSLFLRDINVYAILIAFKDAKFSILGFDSIHYSLKTISIHNFETNDFKGGYFTSLYVPKACIDPSNQCAIMSFYNSYLAVLPLSNIYDSSQDELFNNNDNELFQDSKTQITSPATIQKGLQNYSLPPSFIINIKDLTPKFTNILDFQFLYGYFEPTLTILYEPSQTWSGKVTAKQETVCIITLSINLQQKVYPVIWSMTNLPYDSLRIIPVPQPLGGILVLAINSILYLNQRQTVPVCALALNSLAPPHYPRLPPSSPGSGRSFPPLTLARGSAHATFLTHEGGCRALVSTGGIGCARYLLLRLERSGGSVNPHGPVLLTPGQGHVILGDDHVTGKARDLERVHYLLTGGTDASLHSRLRFGVGIVEGMPRPYGYIQATDMCHCGGNMVFIASHTSDSVLINVEPVVDVDRSANTSNIRTKEEMDSGGLDAEPTQVFQEEPVTGYHNGGFMPTPDADVALQASSPTNGPSGAEIGRRLNIPESAYSFKILDSILNIGPCSQSSLGQPAHSAIEDFGISDPNSVPDLELVVTSGKEDSGALTLLQKSIVPQLITTFNLPGVVNMWTLFESSDRGHVDIGHVYDSDDHILINEDKRTDAEYNSYLLLSMHDSTLVLRTGQEIAEIESSGFDTRSSTLLAGNVEGKGGNLYIIQVMATMVNLLSGDKLVHTLSLDLAGVPGLPLVSAHLVDSYVLLVGELSQVSLIRFAQDPNPRMQVLHGSLGKVYSKPPIVAACLYRDDSGHFTHEPKPENYFVTPGTYQTAPNPTSTLQKNLESGVKIEAVPRSTDYKVEGILGQATIKKDAEKPVSRPKNMAMDDEDELLYGESSLLDLPRDTQDGAFHGMDQNLPHKSSGDPQISDSSLGGIDQARSGDVYSTYLAQASLINTNAQENLGAGDGNEHQKQQQHRPLYKSFNRHNTLAPTYWALICRVNGSLEFYSLPSFQLAYRIKSLHLKCDILGDEHLLLNAPDLPHHKSKKIGSGSAEKKIKISGATDGSRSRRSNNHNISLDQDDDTKQNLLDTYIVKEISLIAIGKGARQAGPIKDFPEFDLDGKIKLEQPEVDMDGLENLPNTPLHCSETTYPSNGADDNVRPHLIAFVNDSLLIYEIYPFPNPNNTAHVANKQLIGDGCRELGGKLIPTLYDSLDPDGTIKRLNIRFRKIHHDMLLGERKAAKSLPKKEAFYKLFNVLRSTPLIRPFRDINGTSGIMIQGLYPHWIVPGIHGDLKVHPMSIDGPIYAFTPFHNVNCHRGFLYFNHKDDLRVGSLPTHLRYDEDWLVRKVPIGRTVHFVEFHIKMKVYAIITSQRLAAKRVVKNLNLNMAAFSAVNMGAAVVLPSASVPTQAVPPDESVTLGAPGDDEGEDEREFEETDSNPTFPAPPEDKFYVDLVTPSSWETIPSARLDFAAEWERVTCFKQVSLASQVTVTGFKDLLVMGTACVYGEDMTCRGRLIILDIIEVVPEPGKPMTRFKIKTLCATEQKGPLVALGSVSGNLVTVIGQKIYVWTLNNNNDLVGLAFIDTSFCVHRMVTVKNLIIIGDLHKSITLLRYDPHSKTISIASRELSHLAVYGIEFVVDNEKLAFLATDRRKNMAIFMYHPQNRESFGGSRLVRKGDFHMDKNVSSLFRIFCKRRDPTSDKKPSLALERRQVTYYLGLDGSIGFVLPINEKLYRRLLMLQNFMDSNYFYEAGLNPKSARVFKANRQQLMNPAKNILDGNLLFRFLNFNALQQELLIKSVGTSLDQIMDDLMEIDRTTNHF